MDLKQLNYFLEVANSGSMQAAAYHLAVPQPSVSRAIKYLETEIGTPLMVRHGRGIRLTQAGLGFREDIAPLIRRFDDIHRDLWATSGKPGGKLEIGVVPSVEVALMADVATAARRQFPEVTMSIRSGLSGTLADHLVNGAIDLAVTIASGLPEEFQLRRLCKFDYFHIVRNELLPPAPWKGTVELEALAGSDLLLPTRPHAIRRRFDDATRSLSVAWNLVAEIDSIPLLKSLVLRGVGGTVLPYAAISDIAADPNLSIRRIGSPALSDALVVAMPPSRPLGILEQKMVQLVADEFGRAVIEGRYIDGSR